MLCEHGTSSVASNALCHLLPTLCLTSTIPEFGMKNYELRHNFRENPLRFSIRINLSSQLTLLRFYVTLNADVHSRRAAPKAVFLFVAMYSSGSCTTD